MKTIVFTGDSHTWGQGAETDNPPDYFGDGTKAVPGDLRRMRSDYPSFFNLLSQRLSDKYLCINSGIGSCSAEKYLNEYWKDFVADYHPDIIVIQPHTINDWLTCEGAKVYKNHMMNYIEKALETAPKVLLTTVSAILGDQVVGNSKDTYYDYISQIYKVAEAYNISVADVYPSLQNPEYFADKWHVNIEGQKIYANMIYENLKELLR